MVRGNKAMCEEFFLTGWLNGLEERTGAEEAKVGVGEARDEEKETERERERERERVRREMEEEACGKTVCMEEVGVNAVGCDLLNKGQTVEIESPYRAFRFQAYLSPSLRFKVKWVGMR